MLSLSAPPSPSAPIPSLPSPQAMSHDIEYSEKYADEDYEYRRRSRAATHHHFWQLPQTPLRARDPTPRARAQARHPAQAYREDDDQGPSAARDGVARPRRHAESRLGSLRDPQVRTRARARGSATVACLALIPLARRASGRSLTSSSSAGQTTQTPSPASLLEASASTRPARSSTDDRRPSSPVSLPPPRPDT